MSYPTDHPGLDEARMAAIASMIVASLPDLNAALARDSYTQGIVWTAGEVFIGDPMSLVTKHISIIGGGESDGTDATADLIYANRGAGWGYEFSTHIIVYYPTSDLSGNEVATEATLREIAMSRICDHLRARVFNVPATVVDQAAAVDIPLGSREFRAAPDADGHYDVLTHCYVRQIQKGITYKGFGGNTAMLFANLLHRGQIR